MRNKVNGGLGDCDQGKVGKPGRLESMLRLESQRWSDSETTCSTPFLYSHSNRSRLCIRGLHKKSSKDRSQGKARR